MKKQITIVNKIADHLRHEITYSKMKSGQHIIESEISKKFNISRVPVREAFRILQSEGYLEVIANRGTFVRTVTYEHINEMAILYKLLFPVVLRNAIPRYRNKTYITAGSVLDKIEKCEDFSEVGYLLWDFARAIFGPSKMKFILSLFDDIYMNSIRSLNEVFEIKMGHKYDVSNHRKFLKLCKENETEKAIKVWEEQINKIERISLKGKKSK